MSEKLQSAMVVDDDPDDLALARRHLLRSERFERVLTASDGAEAVAAFKKYSEGHPVEDGFPPLLMLLDINMPGASGFEVLETMVSLEGVALPHVVVMLSSSDATEDRKRAAQYTIVSDYVVKPLTRAVTHRLADQVEESER
ncbi:MAG: response regulator transcription factor [Sandaracinaceae bacterium]